MAKPPPTFASLEGLLDHGQRQGFDFRPTLLRVLTDLYLQKPNHPAGDERHYTELALRLINSTDVPARAAVAERLAPYAAAPRAVILRLARDVIDVAGPVLRHSPCLTPADLELITLECGAAHAAIIATRLRRHEPPAGNPPGEIKEDEPAGTEAAELSELFFAAGGAERRHILLNLEYAAPASPRAPLTQANAIGGRLETAALAGNVEAFTHEVEFALGVSSRLAQQIVGDELGEPLVVVAKALRAPRAVLERILLVVNARARQSVQRVHELATRHDEISTQAALHLVAIWQAADPGAQEQPRPQPVLRRAGPEGARPPPFAARRLLAARDSRPRSLANH